MKLILGSTSPRRKTILSALFDSIVILAPSAAETHRPPETPIEFATRISEKKCLSILATDALEAEAGLLITADTVVSIDGAIIGKPADFDDAVRIISLLSGRTHEVITGLTLVAIDGRGSRRGPVTGFEITEVKFKNLDRKSIISYLGTIDYRDKAGSYAFQEQGGMIIEGYQGSVTNIIGFPLRLFFAMAEGLGLARELFS
jgi:septum formation protein